MSHYCRRTPGLSGPRKTMNTTNQAEADSVESVVRPRGEIDVHDRVLVVATGEIGIVVGINRCDAARKYGVRTSRGLSDHPRRALSVRMK